MRTIQIHRPVASALLFLAARAYPAGAQGPDTLSLSLEAAVERVLQASDEARTAAANVEVAEAQLLTARASGLPQLRLNGCVLASLTLPHVAVRMCSTSSDDSRCSHAFTSSLRMLPCGGAGSLSTEALGSPPG